MGAVTINPKVSADKARMRIEIREDAVLLAWVDATATDIDNLIATLAGLRSAMIPEVARQLSDGDVKAEVDPLWAIPTHAAAKDKMLFVRSSGLGWVPFLFSEHECRNLGTALLSGVSQQPSGQNPAPVRH
jgi:hypothetical protein